MESDGLRVEHLIKKYGPLVATDEISLSFESGTLYSIIGPNGAGKTTLFNLLSGTLQPTSGSIYFRGTDVTSYGPAQMVEQGVLRSFQITNLFNDLTVLENVRVAVQANHTEFNFWRRADEYPEFISESESILSRVGLLDKKDVVVANLSHGEQRTLELAVCLGRNPDLLLLDEPTSGMSAEETGDMVSLVNELATDIDVLLVEHKMGLVMEVSDRIIVLNNGSVLAEGTPNEIQANEQVQEVYLQGT